MTYKMTIIPECNSHVRVERDGIMYYLKLSLYRTIEAAEQNMIKEYFEKQYNHQWLLDKSDLAADLKTNTILRHTRLFGRCMMLHHAKIREQPAISHPVVMDEDKYTKVTKGDRIYWIKTDQLKRLSTGKPGGTWDNELVYAYVADMIFDHQTGWIKQMQV